MISSNSPGNGAPGTSVDVLIVGAGFSDAVSITNEL